MEFLNKMKEQAKLAWAEYKGISSPMKRLAIGAGGLLAVVLIMGLLLPNLLGLLIILAIAAVIYMMV